MPASWLDFLVVTNDNFKRNATHCISPIAIVVCVCVSVCVWICAAFVDLSKIV